MQRNDLQILLARVYNGDHKSDAYREFVNHFYHEKFSLENYHDILKSAQLEMKKPEPKNNALLWDLYLYAKESMQPYHPNNIISITAGMLHQSPYAFKLRAFYYWEGVKCEVDYTQTYALLQIAAKMGEISANYNLAIMHANGQGRPKNDVLARYYYELAAQQQFSFAYAELGMFAKHGRAGFKKDYTQALAFFKKAIELGNKVVVDEIYRLAYRMYPNAQYGMDSDKAIPIYTMIADLDHPGGLTTLGKIYHIQKKYMLAQRLFERASEFNQAIALNNLGAMYVNGEGVQKDVGIGMHYLKRAMKAGSHKAHYTISNLYYSKDFEFNAAKSIKYLEKGVANNEIDCIVSLAYYYYLGQRGLQKDFAKSISLYKQGAELNNAVSHYNLAFFYFRENIDSITEAEAYHHLDFAIAAKDSEACFLRAELYTESNQLDLAAKLYRKLFLYRGNEPYENALEKFLPAKRGSTIQRYHWYMTDVTDTLPAKIFKLYQRHPWTIIQAILNDDIITDHSKPKYLSQLPGSFLTHIKHLGVYHPTRVQLEKISHQCELAVMIDRGNDAIEQSEFLERLDELSTGIIDERLSAYLTMTILFEAIINDWIDALEVPRTLARLYQCHKTIMHLDHSVGQQAILYEQPHTAYMSLDAYLHLLSPHLQLIEAYVSILRSEVDKISHLLSPKQSLALVNTLGLLMLTDNLLAPNLPHVHPEHISNFSDTIKTIHTPLLWLSVKQNSKKTEPQLQLTKALQFFHIEQENDVPSDDLNNSTHLNTFYYNE